jgi:hypothetical protein
VVIGEHLGHAGWVTRTPVGTCRSSFGPWAFDPGPSTPVLTSNPGDFAGMRTYSSSAGTIRAPQASPTKARSRSDPGARTALGLTAAQRTARAPAGGPGPGERSPPVARAPAARAPTRGPRRDGTIERVAPTERRA